MVTNVKIFVGQILFLSYHNYFFPYCLYIHYHLKARIADYVCHNFTFLEPSSFLGEFRKAKSVCIREKAIISQGEK